MRYNMGCIRYIYKQNERHIVSILLMVEIGDFYLRIKQKRFLYVCPVFSSDQDNAKITFLFNMTLCLMSIISSKVNNFLKTSFFLRFDMRFYLFYLLYK